MRPRGTVFRVLTNNKNIVKREFTVLVKADTYCFSKKPKPKKVFLKKVFAPLQYCPVTRRGDSYTVFFS